MSQSCYSAFLNDGILQLLCWHCLCVCLKHHVRLLHVFICSLLAMLLLHVSLNSNPEFAEFSKQLIACHISWHTGSPPGEKQPGPRISLCSSYSATRSKTDFQPPSVNWSLLRWLSKLVLRSTRKSATFLVSYALSRRTDVLIQWQLSGSLCVKQEAQHISEVSGSLLAPISPTN